MSWINNSNNEIENFINENEEFLKDEVDNPDNKNDLNYFNKPPDEINSHKRITTEEINTIFE